MGLYRGLTSNYSVISKSYEGLRSVIMALLEELTGDYFVIIA